jgi:hypothetical protein
MQWPRSITSLTLTGLALSGSLAVAGIAVSSSASGSRSILSVRRLSAQLRCTARRRAQAPPRRPGGRPRSSPPRNADESRGPG